MQQKERQFTQSVIMTCSQEQYEQDLKEGLLSMGYKEHSMYRGYRGEEYTDLVIGCENVCDKEIDFINIKSFSKVYEVSTVLSGYNPDLYLALAAMSEGEEPYLGEWFICLKSDTGWNYSHKKGDFIKVEFEDDDSDTNLTFGLTYDRGFYRKATVKELINHFDSKSTESIEPVPEYQEKQLKVGDTVRISEDSKYYAHGESNPIDTNGVVSRITKDPDFPLRVEWENGKDNSYNYEDLIPFPQEEVTEEKEEEFILPENWAVEVTRENEYLLNGYRDIMKPRFGIGVKMYPGYFLNPSYPDGSYFVVFEDLLWSNTKIISTEEFKKYVLGKESTPTINVEESSQQPEQWVPQHGELCEFSDQGLSWREAFFVGLNPFENTSSKFVGVTKEGYSGSWIYVRQLLPEVKVSKADIAKMMNCEERQIVIED